MPLDRPLETIRATIKSQLVDDLATALKSLQVLLPENSEKHSIVIAMLGRLNDANKARLRNTLSNDDLQREYDRIRADLLDLIQDLEEGDFDASTKPGDKIAPKKGKVLYRIPHVMPLEKETRCIVRIALEEDAIVENISLDEHVHLRSLYRVSNTMQAEIFDPSGGEVFHIRCTSEPVQIIDEYGYTEWRFYVTPHIKGAHPLEVKVSIIEMKDGQPHKKELVLEETIQVVTENFDSSHASQPMKAAGYALAFQTSHAAGFSYDSPQNSSPARTANGNWGLRAVAFSLAFLVFGTTATWAITPLETRDWFVARYITDTPFAYRQYIEKYPKGRHMEMAIKVLDSIEITILQEIERDPTSQKISHFLVNFPESKYLEKLKQVVESNESIRDEFMPLIQMRIDQNTLKQKHPKAGGLSQLSVKYFGNITPVQNITLDENGLKLNDYYNFSNIDSSVFSENKNLQEFLTNCNALAKHTDSLFWQLKNENDQLKSDKLRLDEENQQLRRDTLELRKELNDLIAHKIEQAKFRATSFGVQIEKRGDVLTILAREAREIFVSFDLAYVPESFQGSQNLYLVITDDKGESIGSSNQTKLTIQGAKVAAQEAKHVELTYLQRIAFVHKLDQKLKPGNYAANIYCDIGLLGSVSFRLK